MSNRAKRATDDRPQQALEHRLTHLSDLRIPGFLKSVPPGTIYQRTFAQTDTERWFDGFCTHLRSALGKRFVPVYRIADGEFMYCVGQRLRLRLGPWHRLHEDFQGVSESDGAS